MFQRGELFIDRPPWDRSERTDKAVRIQPGGEDVEIIHVSEQIGELGDAFVPWLAEVLEGSEPGLDGFPEVVEFVLAVLRDDRSELGAKMFAEFSQSLFGAMGKVFLWDRAEGGAGVAEADLGPGDRLTRWTPCGRSRVLLQQGPDGGDRGFSGVRTFGKGQPLPGGAAGNGIARAA